MTFERLKSIDKLPLFPLPVVLFPGVPLPLLIFEPRYRQLLADISVGNRLFGLSFFDPESSSTDLPPIGHVGCVAEVTEVQPLPDGRSNIMTVGVIRYHLDSYVDGEILIWLEMLPVLKMNPVMSRNCAALPKLPLRPF